MLSVRHFNLIIKHLDAVDQRVSQRLDRTRPWTETHLTSLLCDLLDDETEHDELLSYSRKQLREDLANSDEAMTLACRIESIEYLPDQERYVTQGDLGLILSYRDRVGGESWERGWLLQAKRATPTLRERPAFRADAKFAVDSAQHARLETLMEVLGGDVVRYLLYAPRPSMLRDWDRTRLAQARNGALQRHIFDYTFGQALYQDAKDGCPTLAAGMFLAPHEAVPSTVVAAHSELAQTVWPFSWFVALQLGGRRADPGRPSPRRGSGNPAQPVWNPVNGPEAKEMSDPKGIPIVPFLRGDPHAVQDVVRRCGEQSDNIRESPFLPSHTMTIEVVPGGTLPG